jgi:hypothetical protein
VQLPEPGDTDRTNEGGKFQTAEHILKKCLRTRGKTGSSRNVVAFAVKKSANAGGGPAQIETEA